MPRLIEYRIDHRNERDDRRRRDSSAFDPRRSFDFDGNWPMNGNREGLMHLNNIRGKFVYYLLVIDLMNILRMEEERYF